MSQTRSTPSVHPVRQRFLDALARRMAGQPARVQRLLEAKLQQALADNQARIEPQQPAAPATPAAAALPLTQLNAHIRRVTASSADHAIEGQRDDELPSVRRFRRAWAIGRVQDQLELAVARKPANAGPLNSHALVVETLALMGELSPAYLGRFLAQVEALQWLEQGAVKPAKARRAARRGGPAA